MNPNVHSEKLKGHWFCDHCDDVVFMSYHFTSSANVPCPVCTHLACNFIPAKITRKILPEDWFREMHLVVAAAKTPELFDQRKHKKIL
jgi:hypothetical protein